MAGLFDISRRRKHSRDWADQFREGASPEELEYFDRFYQEPSSSPVLARGALEGELDSADALRRQLMARGMNALQADDATRRALAQEEAQLGRTSESIATQYGPGGLKGTGEGSFESYQQGLKPEPSSVGWGIHPDDQDRGLSLDDWSRQRAMARQDASGVSAESKASYDEQTVNDRISMIEQQAASLPEELKAKGAGAEVTSKLMGEISRLLSKAIEDPKNATTYADQAQELLRFTKAATSGGFSSYGGPQRHIDNDIEEKVNQSQASGDTVVEQDGQKMIVPRQTNIEGEYRR
jgi:hypothetical protein